MKFAEAIEQVLASKKEKFVETVDLALRLNINPKKQDQAVRDTCCLPHPIPKQIRLLVIDDSLSSEEVKELGIDHYGTIDMIEKMQGGWLDFDLIITTSKMMPQVLKLGKVLGPKGLMPNAKSGSVTSDIKKTVTEFKKGKIEFKNDSFGNLHVSIGKCNFSKEQLQENFDFIINLLKNKKPQTIKGQFIKNLYVSSTMGKSFKLDLN